MARSKGPTVEFDDAVVERETDMALLVRLPDQEESVWFPKSQVDDDSEVFDDDENSRGKLVVSEWIAQEKGLI